MMLAAAGLTVAASLGAQPVAPRAYTRGDVSYMSGGIGSDEARVMRDAAADYPLTLELAAAAGGPRDEYVSNAEVRIVDSRGGQVLDTRTDGPFMLVRLPAGTYSIDVQWNGVHRQRTVEIGERRQHLLMEFPTAAEAR
jgi:hypothetical protein